MFIFGGFRRSWAAATPDCMMTSSNGNIFRVTGPLCGEFIGPGEFPAQRPVTRSFDVFFHPRLYKRLNKQPWGWWFETPAWSLWRHRNGYGRDIHYKINILLIWIRKEKNKKNHGIGGGNLFSNSHIFISHLKTSTDWPIVCRWHFQMHFLGMTLFWIFLFQYKVCSYECNWQDRFIWRLCFEQA